MESNQQEDVKHVLKRENSETTAEANGLTSFYLSSCGFLYLTSIFLF